MIIYCFGILENWVNNTKEEKLSEVKIEDGESLESALKRFKKKVQKAGILTEIRRREHYEKPSVKKKRKRAQARRKKRF